MLLVEPPGKDRLEYEPRANRAGSKVPALYFCFAYFDFFEAPLQFMPNSTNGPYSVVPTVHKLLELCTVAGYAV